MVKHGGCFLCGSRRDEYLKSTPDMSTMESVALCSECRALPNDALRRKIDSIREAIRKATEAVANG